FLASPDREMRKTAAWVASHHPEWGNELADFFRDHLRLAGLATDELEELKQQLARFAHNEAIQAIMASALKDDKTPATTRQTVLQAIALAALKEAPASWVGAVRAYLAESDGPLLHLAVATARVLSQVKTNAPNFSEALMRIARNETHSA